MISILHFVDLQLTSAFPFSPMPLLAPVMTTTFPTTPFACLDIVRSSRVDVTIHRLNVKTDHAELRGGNRHRDGAEKRRQWRWAQRGESSGGHG
jgi:hypothetical protein